MGNLTLLGYDYNKWYTENELDEITFVVFSKASPSIPEVTLNAPDFFKITSVVCFSDPNLKPFNKEQKLNQNR